jgi:TolB protein
MTSLRRAAFIGAAFLATATHAPPARAQDTTYKGITLNGVYDPRRDKVSIVVLPIAGAFGDSVRRIIQRDLDYSDRFSVIAVDSADPNALRAAGAGTGLNYQLFAHLTAAAVVQITPVPTGLHVALHDVARARVVNVNEFSLPNAGLSRDWRMAVHRVSDEIERWITGARGISATRIAYVRGTSMRIIDFDGADEITVPADECSVSPAWSPNGAMIAYGTCGANSHIVIIDLATGRSRPVIGPTRNTTYGAPVFMPDGNSLLYGRAGDNGSDVFRVSVGGGDTPRRITNGQGTDNFNPTPSPDGRRFVFMSGRTGHPELYISDADGANAEVLTDYEQSDKNFRADPDWSPDGRMIAYSERTRDRFQIRTVLTTGSTPKYLTSEGENEQPSWAPDSRHLVFTSTRTGVRQLWIIDFESGRTRQLTSSAGARLGAWSPRLGSP